MIYAFARSGLTPNTANDNWTIDADAAGEIGAIIRTGWGGEATSSTAMRTRIVRPTTSGTTGTTGTASLRRPNSQSPKLRVLTNWTTQPVIPAADTGDLIAKSWNAHGGGFEWVASQPEDEIYLVNGVLTGSVSCRNVAGIGVSSYELTWREF